MRLLIYSDLHLENHPFVPPPHAVEQADVVVLAGDIRECGGLLSARRLFGDKPIVYVAGNHEFYDGHWDRAMQRMRRQADDLDIHFLEQNAVELGGVRFLGCTLWTDFQFFGSRQEALVTLECGRFMPDYKVIRCDAHTSTPSNALAPDDGFGFAATRLLQPADTQRRHRESRAWLEEALAQGESARTVVVTHHLPHQRSVAHRYKQSFTTGAYASRLPASLIQRCGLWIHGHSHDSVDYRFGDSKSHTRVISNPRGYRMLWLDDPENIRFNPDLLVDFP